MFIISSPTSRHADQWCFLEYQTRIRPFLFDVIVGSVLFCVFYCVIVFCCHDLRLQSFHYVYYYVLSNFVHYFPVVIFYVDDYSQWIWAWTNWSRAKGRHPAVDVVVAVDKAALEAVAAVASAVAVAAAAAEDRISDRMAPVAEALCVGAGRWQDVLTGSVLIQRWEKVFETLRMSATTSKRRYPIRRSENIFNWCVSCGGNLLFLTDETTQYLPKATWSGFVVGCESEVNICEKVNTMFLPGRHWIPVRY